MKYLAHTEQSTSSPIVSIYEVDGRTQATYYSLFDLVPMSAKAGFKSRTPHFAFKSGYAGDGTGESAEHSITKYVIYRSGVLHLRHEKGGGEVQFDDVQIEHRFDDGKYVADLYARIKSDTILGLKCGEWLVIEICKTHRVDRVKQNFFVSNNIAAIEIKYWNDIKLEHSQYQLQRRIEGWLSKPQYFRWLHNPHSRLISKISQPAPRFGPIVVTPPSANARPKRSFVERLRRFLGC